MPLLYGRLPGTIPAGLKDLTYYAAGALPKAPASVAVPVPPAAPDGTPWGMDGNDTYGDCGVAGINHYFMADAAIAREGEQFPDDTEITQYYLTYTGGQDTGVVLSDFLAYVKKTEFYGHTIEAYAPVGVHDVPTLHFAIWAYGAAYTGITVTTGMMNTFNAGQPWTMEDLFSDIDGGHCVPLVGYDSKYLYCVTWGKVQPIEYSAWHYCSSEAWGVISGEFVSKGGDTRGLSLAALKADLSRIGR